jgi:photosystem II stability/assembly factor-like uncharacterized protein
MMPTLVYKVSISHATLLVVRLTTLLVSLLALTVRLDAQVVQRTWERLMDPPTAVWTVHFLDLGGPPRIGFIGCSEAVYRTTDGGNTWAPCTVNAPQFTASDFSFKDSLTGWFSNYTYSTSRQLAMCYKTTDGGLTWDPIYGPTVECSSVLYRPENHLLLLASWLERPAALSGHSCYSTDEGLTWNVYWQDQKLNGFAFVDTLNGIVTSAGLLYLKTTDGGYTWTNVNSTGDEAWQPAAIKRTKSYFAASEITDLLFSSSDLGNTFQQRTRIGTTTGTLREGSCGTLYAQFSQGSGYRHLGVIRSQDGGQSWIPLHGPVNMIDSRFYVKGGYVFAGGIDTITKTYSVWRYVEDSTFYDGGSFDAPQVSDTIVRMVSPDCGITDSTLAILYLNDCAPAELIAAELSATNRFTLGIRDSLPLRLSGTYKIPINYEPIGHDGDSVTLTLTYRTHGQDGQRIVTIIGSVPGTHTIARFSLLAGGQRDVTSLAGQTVPIDLMLLNAISDTLGLDSIAFTLTYDENVATPGGFTANPPWALLRESHSFGRTDIAFRRTEGANLDANSTVATFRFKSFLSAKDRTDIVVTDFRLNDGDSVYLGCIATATDPGTVDYIVADTCGDRLLRRMMAGAPILERVQEGLRVRALQSGEATIEIYDLLGELRMAQRLVLGAEPAIVDITSLAPGVYVSRIETDRGLRSSYRFVR